MSGTEQALRDRRLMAWLEMKELAEAAAAADRCLSVAEQAGWEALNDETRLLNKHLKQVTDALIGLMTANEFRAREGLPSGSVPRLRVRRMTLDELYAG